MLDAISGHPTKNPVVNKKSGVIYDKGLLLKYLAENESRDPVSGDTVSEDDFVALVTTPALGITPRPPNVTSIPALLGLLQNEWDAAVLETLDARRLANELKKELSHALYKEEAALRVIARLEKERDEARLALQSVRASMGNDIAVDGPRASNDTAIHTPQLPDTLKQVIAETKGQLSSQRKQLKTKFSSVDESAIEHVRSSLSVDTIPSLHSTNPQGVSAVAMTADAIYTGGLDTHISILDRRSGTQSILKGHKAKVTQIKLLPSGVLSSSLDGSVIFWKDNEPVRSWRFFSSVSGIDVHPSQSFFAASSLDGKWHIVDLTSEDSSPLVSVDTPAEATTLAFHPDGFLLAVGGSDGSTRVFDVAEAKLLSSLDDPHGDVSSISFSENGVSLAVGYSKASMVNIWNLRKLTAPRHIDLGSDAFVRAVAFDPSAQLLAIAGSHISLYHAKTFDLLYTFDDNVNDFSDLSWVESELAASSIDRTVRIFK